MVRRTLLSDPLAAGRRARCFRLLRAGVPELRHVLLPALGRGSRERAHARLPGAVRAHPPSAGDAGGHPGVAVRERGRGRDAGDRDPRDRRAGAGDLPPRPAAVLLAGGAARRADRGHAAAVPQLRDPRLRGPRGDRARGLGGGARGAASAAGLAGARACSGWPGCCGRRPGSTRARTGSGCSPRATGRAGSSWRRSRRPRRSRGASATWRSPATSSGRCTAPTTWPPSCSGRPGS